MLEDTIAAIATPLGEGGIGIVRISGTESIIIAEKIFRSLKEKDWVKNLNYGLIYGYIVDPFNNSIVDEVLLSVMRAPNSYTRENIVEINCHGGLVPLRKTFELVLNSGARTAEPGEFTKRAFLNGRLDLAQAESVIDVIRAKTSDSLSLAVKQLEGKLSEKISNMQDKLLYLLAHVEAVIDFPEEDIEASTIEKIKAEIKDIIKEINKWIELARAGKIYREGLAVVIAGKPNVGKSSLLNALLKEKRAIVTEIPGTTRDAIEEYINIKGIPVKITDTAGLRETGDTVEKIGVQISKEKIMGADIILYMLDVKNGFTDVDCYVLDEVINRNLIVIINKIDVGSGIEIINNISNKYENLEIVQISALKDIGLDLLEDAIASFVFSGNAAASNEIIISNTRHKSVLKRVVYNLQDVIEGIENAMPLDIVSIDLRNAWETLGEITGSSVTEDIIDKIFKEFCIGK
ncbi:tRNA modification GTPase TrmE [Desulfofarcimen acetoxidans DSM 771]|uniref:tRNA modification GTPase MnmE n=1 Tax=Desulfofarcimen acetoxidans (strain ATCC 49208 / DSM 771 / KCTC 5769 / VKM B-1644 / 5575) TaxID=485916 RepID=C8W060_DESAS|nr:tRNA uridine-5-carboxymethylaminomethyl(34) synthesis GTPase MnmE [Desulfofarcimen acetoxidans]ACV65028.1 tRNA modification GTPase TrmE [Desulfofarcimen acetoxidans DSM 771]